MAEHHGPVSSGVHRPRADIAGSRQRRPIAVPRPPFFPHRVRARQDVRAAGAALVDDLGSRAAAVRLAGLPRRRGLDARACAVRLRNVLRRVDLDPGAGPAGAGAFGVGEVETRRRRTDVRRLLCRRGLRRHHQWRAAHQLGTPVQHQLPDRLGLGEPVRGRRKDHQRRRVFPRAARRGTLCGICLYMLARKIRGREVVK